MDPPTHHCKDLALGAVSPAHPTFTSKSLPWGTPKAPGAGKFTSPLLSPPHFLRPVSLEQHYLGLLSTKASWSS